MVSRIESFIVWRSEEQIHSTVVAEGRDRQSIEELGSRRADLLEQGENRPDLPIHYGDDGTIPRSICNIVDREKVGSTSAAGRRATEKSALWGSSR